MRRFAIEVVLAAVIGCGGAGTRAPAEPARSSADPVVVALRDDRGASLEGGLEGAPRPPSAATSAPQEPPAVAPVPSAQALATPARSTTIRLSSPAGGPGDAELAAGDEAFERGDLAEAQRHYRAARSAGAREPAPAVGLARVTIARLDLPLDYAAARDNATVAAVARELAQAVKSGPPFGPAFVELGRARLLLGDADGAIDALKIGVGLLSQEPEAHSQLGVALLATGHSDGAVRELSRALDLDPGNAARHGNLGTALLMLGRTREAIAE
jgi:Flp pilus assembly protein TadD